MEEKKKRKDSKKTFRQIISESALRKKAAWAALWRTQAFRQFCQENRAQIEEELKAKLRGISEKPENEREDYENLWLEWDHDRALTEAFQTAFVGSFKGQQVMTKLKEFEFKKLAISFSRELHDGKYLSCRIDMTFSKEQIRAEFEHRLKEMHPQIKRPPRGAAIMNLEEKDKMFRAFDLVEIYLNQGDNNHQSVLKATWKLFTKVRCPRLKNPPAEDKRYQQVSRWHKRAKEIIQDL